MYTQTDPRPMLYIYTQDELLQVALARWLLEYWTQPTDFSWEDFLPMMQVRYIHMHTHTKTTP